MEQDITYIIKILAAESGLRIAEKDIEVKKSSESTEAYIRPGSESYERLSESAYQPSKR